jgi:hypothetical protein
MKRLLIVLLIGLSSVTHAQHRHGDHHHHGGHGGGYNWVAPLIVGGVVTYALTRPQPPVVVQQPPVIVQQPAPVAPVGYHYENILDANCSCYRLVLVQN